MNRAKLKYGAMGVTGDLGEINSSMMIIYRNIYLIGSISTLYASRNKKFIVTPLLNPVKLACH